MGNKHQKMYACLQSKSSRMHEHATLIIGGQTASPSSSKSANHKIDMNQGDDSIDDCN